MNGHIELLRRYNQWRRGGDGDMPHPRDIGQAIDFAVSRIPALEAKIDALMLEFCPEDMTSEQIKRWEAHQKPEESK